MRGKPLVVKYANPAAAMRAGNDGEVAASPQGPDRAILPDNRLAVGGMNGGMGNGMNGGMNNGMNGGMSSGSNGGGTPGMNTGMNGGGGGMMMAQRQQMQQMQQQMMAQQQQQMMMQGGMGGYPTGNMGNM